MRLRQLRKRKGLTQAQLSAKTGIYIAHHESGRRDPTLKTLIKLADGLEVPVSMLLSEDFGLEVEDILTLILSSKPLRAGGRTPEQIKDLVGRHLEIILSFSKGFLSNPLLDGIFARAATQIDWDYIKKGIEDDSC